MSLLGHIPSQWVPEVPHHGAMHLVNKQGGVMSMATAVPGRRDAMEICLWSKAELVKSYKVYTFIMAVLWQGPQQEMPR